MITTLKTGDLAFYDSMRSGFVPGKIESVHMVNGAKVVTLRVTATRGPYVRGDRVRCDVPHLNVIGRGQVRVRHGRYRINGGTEFTVDA